MHKKNGAEVFTLQYIIAIFSCQRTSSRIFIIAYRRFIYDFLFQYYELNYSISLELNKQVSEQNCFESIDAQYSVQSIYASIIDYVGNFFVGVIQ